MTDAAPGCPVSIVTGFLGSGKTTLIGQVLRDPGFARTAVIVNEFGEIGIDHALIATGSEAVLALTTGCLCCRMQGDLATTLRGLAGQGNYDRVLIETSGLVDPAPLLASVLIDPEVTAGHRLDCVVTLVDARAGAATLDRHIEARRQVAVADRIVLTKTDLAGPVPALRARLADVAPVVDAVRGAIDPAVLFGPVDAAARAGRLAGLAPDVGPNPFARGRHGAGLGSVVLEHDRPIAGAALSLFLEALLAHAGPRLLRLKGLVEIVEAPGRPLLLQAAQHGLAPPEFLDGWPQGWEGGGRLVLIGQDLPPYFAQRLLAAVEEEVGDAAGG
ncbi:MAG: GTP-binding protein [Proteobacteria bacterium]|nr:GTP-binding protein [Pseudomonadota bacterium]